MKIGKGNFSAVFKGLCFSVVVLALAGISVRAYSDETPGGAAKTLPIKLTPSALVAITGEGTIVNFASSSSAPRRAILTEPVNKKRLYIAASNETDWGTKKAYLTLGEQEDATRIDNNGGLINGDASLNDGRTGIYDVLGRQVAVLGENDLHFHSPVGATPWILMLLLAGGYILPKRKRLSEQK